MIKLILVITFFIIAPVNKGQKVMIEKLDSNLRESKKSIDTIKGKANAPQASINAINKKNVPISSGKTANPKSNGAITSNNKNPSSVVTGFIWILVFSPMILFLIIGVALVFRFKFNFKDALSEINQPKKIIKNPEYNITSINSIGSNIQNFSSVFPPTIEVSQSWPSLYDLFLIVENKIRAAEIAQEKLILAKTEYDKAGTDANTAGNDLQDEPDDVLKQKAKSDADNELKHKEREKKRAEGVLKNAQEEANAWMLFYEESKGREKGDDLKFYIKPSISRYIALIAFILTIVLVLCMGCFFIYHYLITGLPPDFRSLTNIVVLLALGFTPYISNKITKAFKNHS